jgi:hypothetical protein
VTGTDDESAVSDLLADLMHLADYLGEDWSSLLASAEMHHTAERAEEDNAPTYRVERVNQLGIGALGV